MGILEVIEQKAKELEETKIKAIKSLAKEMKKHKPIPVNYISRKPRIFTIQFSDLKNNWTPKYYDYELQVNVIIHELIRTNPDNLVNKWNTIKEKGIARFLPNIVIEYGMENPYAMITKELKRDWYDTSYEVIHFHPEVIKLMDQLLF